MRNVVTDVAIIGAGGAGLRAAIALAEKLHAVLCGVSGIRPDPQVHRAGGHRARAPLEPGWRDLALVVVIGLLLWSAAHRLRITCYDLGVRADAAVAAIVYAGALAATGAAVLYLLRI